jgi:MSHA biogenesis protein MshI
VCNSGAGTAATVVRREQGAPPFLELCEFIPAGTAARALERLPRGLDRVACATVADFEHYALLVVEAPDVPAAELRAAMRWRVKDLIEFNVEDAVIDVFDVPEGRGARPTRMVYAVVARARALGAVLGTLERTGLVLDVIDIPELAIRNVTAALPEDAGGVAFVHLGGRQGLIVLTRQSTLYLSRRIDTGTEFLARGGARELTADIEGWLDAIGVEIQRSLDYYESHFGQPPVAGVVLAPLGLEIAGLAEYLGRQLGVRARMLDLNSVIDSAEPIAVPLQPHCLLALGAALRTVRAA